MRGVDLAPVGIAEKAVAVDVVDVTVGVEDHAHPQIARNESLVEIRYALFVVAGVDQHAGAVAEIVHPCVGIAFEIIGVGGALDQIEHGAAPFLRFSQPIVAHPCPFGKRKDGKT